MQTGILIGTISPGQGNNKKIQESKTAVPAAVQQVVEPDEGFHGLAQVVIEAAPLQNKTAAPGDTVTADPGFYGLGQVDVREYVLQSKSVDPALTAQIVEPDAGYDGLDCVNVGAVLLQDVTVKSGSARNIINVPAGYNGHGSVTVDPVLLQGKAVEPGAVAQTVGPANNAQTINADNGYYGLGTVRVESAPLQDKTAVAGDIVTADSGFYGLNKVTVEAMNFQQKSVSPKTTAQTVTPDSGYDGLSSVTVNGVSTGTATNLDVLAGTTFARADILGNISTVNGSMTDNGAWSATINSLSNVTVPWGYHNGSGTVSVDSTNLIAVNIKKNVTILGVTGTYEGSGGGSSQFENRLFQMAKGSATITHSGTYYGIIQVNNLTLKGCTVVASDAFGYNETSYAYTLKLPDIVTIKSNAFRQSAINKLYLGTSGSSTQITLNNYAFNGCVNFAHLYLPGSSVVTLPGTTNISSLLIFTVHVPADLLESYKAATNWSALTNVEWVGDL